MKFIKDSIEASHADTVKWVEWFLLEQTRRGLPKNEKDRAGFIIMAFLESGPAFIKAEGEPMINCPKCQGRGHSNLFLAGQTQPTPCKNCEGTGRVVVGPSEVTP